MTKGRKAVSIILSVVMIITSLFTVSSFAGEKKEEKSESYIVVYEEDTSNREIREDVKGDVIDITKTDDSKIALIEPEGKDIRDLKEDSSVKYIQPNYEYHTLGNDPYMSKENAVNYQYFHLLSFPFGSVASMVKPFSSLIAEARPPRLVALAPIFLRPIPHPSDSESSVRSFSLTGFEPLSKTFTRQNVLFSDKPRFTRVGEGLFRRAAEREHIILAPGALRWQPMRRQAKGATDERRRFPMLENRS